jgi:hypothetical protein
VLSEAAKAIVERCYKDGIPVSVRPILKETYTLGNITFKFTEQLLEELSQSGKVKVGNRHGDAINIMGM